VELMFLVCIYSASVWLCFVDVQVGYIFGDTQHFNFLLCYFLPQVSNGNFSSIGLPA